MSQKELRISINYDEKMSDILSKISERNGDDLQLVAE